MKSTKWVSVSAPFVALAIGCAIVYKYVDPAPPNHLVITTGDGEGDYQAYAKQYQEILKEDGITLEIRTSSGAMENLHRLQDPKFKEIEVGFVQDGLGSPDDSPDVSSLGSLYYEPIWVFYRSGGAELTRFSQLIGRRIAVGQEGGGTRTLALNVLKASGVTEANATFASLAWDKATDALKAGGVDAAFLMGTPDEPLIKSLIIDPKVRLMNVDQAEAITRLMPYLHHLVLPHGAIDLQRNYPSQDVNLISPTATLIVRDSLHPALIYLLLKAAEQVHSEPGIFERKDEFPIAKDYQFPLSDDAKQFYKTGTPFWQRYLPFWLATLVERFILLVIPMLALIIPIAKLVPRYLNYRVTSKIFKHYGELKYLETQMRPNSHRDKYGEYLDRLDGIEERVNHMKIPLDYSEHLYVLREHIDFVRARLRRVLEAERASITSS